MRCTFVVLISVVLGTFLFEIKFVDSRNDDLYDVLGVDRTATARTIKQAYKQLAKEWHPDKNRSPDANEKFMKINEAYETLSDPQKRSHYDMYGTTSARADPEGQGDSRGGPFDGFTFHFGGRGGGGGGPFQFHFSGQGSTDSKHKINLWTYQNTILKESHTRPYVVYACSDFYIRCMQAGQIWAGFVEDLEKIGSGIAVVDADSSPSIMRELRVRGLPAVVGVIRGRLVHFDGRFSATDLREFVRSLLPGDLVTTVTDNSFESFVSDWSDNKVKAIMFDTRKQPGLRFMMAAFAHRDRIKCGYYRLESHSIPSSLLRKYRIIPREENLIIVKEDDDGPTARVSANQIGREAMDRLMEENLYLRLPRVSDPSMFDYLCPLSVQSKLKRICALLILQGPGTVGVDRPFASSFRAASSRLGESPTFDRVSFGYVYEHTQGDLIHSLSDASGEKKNDSSAIRKVVVIWRNTRLSLKYEYLKGGWTEGPATKDGAARLSDLLTRFLSVSSFGHSLDRVPEVADEFSEGAIWKLLRLLKDAAEKLYESIMNDETMLSTIVMAATTVIFFVVLIRAANPSGVEKPRGPVGAPPSRPSASHEDDDVDCDSYFESNSTRTSSGSRISEGRSSSSMSGSGEGDLGSKVESFPCFIEELCDASYERLVSLGQKGHRSVMILIRGAGNNELLERFRGFVRAYSSPHYRLRFAYLRLTEPHLAWCKKLGVSSKIGSCSSSNSSAMRTLVACLKGQRAESMEGMVLAVNPPNHYYHLYGDASRRRGTDRESNPADFLGFGEEEEDKEREERRGRDVPQRPLLVGFDTWLDKLYDGSLPKVHVSDWPKQLN